MSWVDDFKEGFSEDLNRGADDNAKAFYRMRELQGQDDDAVRLQKMVAEHPVIFRARELMGLADPEAIQARQEMGFGPKQNMAGRLGQLGGAIGNDLINDKSRSFWWLLNAAQAAGNVANEVAVNTVNPDLYGVREVAPNYDLSELEKMGLAKRNGPNGTLAPVQGVSKGKNNTAVKRNYRSGAVAALGIAPGFAINQGLGLMTPFGGYEGYEAVVPSADDPSKTDNVLLEVASKYVLGRTGNLLPYDEFKKVRPDVSPEEYRRYKAFKYDKEIDMNPFDDGKVNLPGSVLKTTTDGIHGAEVQFLGRSLPVNTALIPLASAIGGTVLGARKRIPQQIRAQGKAKMKDYVDQEAVKRGIIGGSIGAGAGMALGNLLEGERRRRNQAENEKQQQL